MPYVVGQVVVIVQGYRIARVEAVTLQQHRAVLFQVRLLDDRPTEPRKLRQVRAGELRAERVCRGCGCTDSRPCPGGCWWSSIDPPVCSTCVATMARDG